jgi:ferrous iron transport protein B
MSLPTAFDEVDCELGSIETTSQPAAGRRILLVGNPNVGKSLLFTRLTRRYVTVSNYPGTTVEITSAEAQFGGQRREVIDTPGTNDLVPRSDEERVTRDLLLSGDADVVVVGDMSNARRTLMLAIQVCEYDLPFIVCLNMADEARRQGSEIDAAALGRRMGVPVVATSALRGWNIERLKREAGRPARPRLAVEYGAEIEAAVDGLMKSSGVTRGMALSLLAGEDGGEAVDAIRRDVEQRIAQPAGYAIARARHAAAEALLNGDAHSPRDSRRTTRQWLGDVAMRPVGGFVVVAVVLIAGWFFVGKLGAGILVDLLQKNVFEHHLNVWALRFADFVFRFPHHHIVEDGILTPRYTVGGTSGMASAARLVHDLLVGPYGVVTMALTYAIAIVLPVVVTFFIFFGVLEDSGYLPRLAVMLHRSFKRMGLNGKAVLPMVLGLGCDTMATLTTRILETKKERVIVTILLALGVPCSAQLGVIMAMLGPLGWKAGAVWLGITIGTIFLVGFLAAKLVDGEPADFILEIPPIRTPKLSNILIKVSARAEWYLKEAVPLFVVGTLLLWFLDATHLLVRLQSALSPLVVGALGLPAEASSAFVVGFLRRDYGAAGLFAMERAGHLSANQTVVALVVITLFIPCIANFFVMIKERGVRAGSAIAAFILVYSFAIGWLLRIALDLFHLRLGA